MMCKIGAIAIKNDSFLFPFGIPGDSLFYANNTGNVTDFEPVFKDVAIMTTIDYLIDDFNDGNNEDYSVELDYEFFDDS